MTTHTLIDLFCGAGGLALGFLDDRFGGGFNEVFAIDSDRAATLTHRLNFGTPVVHGRLEDWMEQLSGIPEADVVVAGLPCQGFSLLNKNRLADPRRDLWTHFLEATVQARAKVFVIENVAELLSSPEYLALRDQALELGFSTVGGILNAADYGTPQHRKRAIVIGWKATDAAQPTFPPPRTHFGSAALGESWRTVRDAIADLSEPIGVAIRHLPPPLDLHFGRSPTAESLERYKAVPPGGNRFDLQANAPHITPMCWIRKTSGGTDLFGRLWWDRPSVTIRTEFFKPEKGRYLHPAADRPITHREAARLMGFPDDFQFAGSKIEIAKQLGNAVPPQLSGALAAVVKNMLSARN